MPFDIDGWIEVSLDAPDKVESEQTWHGLVNLTLFGLSGDYTSEQLFGLSKYADVNQHPGVQLVTLLIRYFQSISSGSNTAAPPRHA